LSLNKTQTLTETLLDEGVEETFVFICFCLVQFREHSDQLDSVFVRYQSEHDRDHRLVVVHDLEDILRFVFEEAVELLAVF
jgi:hypothetical protein